MNRRGRTSSLMDRSFAGSVDGRARWSVNVAGASSPFSFSTLISHRLSPHNITAKSRLPLQRTAMPRHRHIKPCASAYISNRPSAAKRLYPSFDEVTLFFIGKMPAILHLENPPLRTVSLARSKELQLLRNRRFSVLPQPITPPRPTQTLVPSSCPAKIPTDWGKTPYKVEPLHLNLLGANIGNDAILDTDHRSPLEAWKCDHGTEQPSEVTELEEFTIDTPLKTSMFYRVESWIADFDDEGLKSNLRREFSISTTRQSLPRDVTSWYYSPITPDPSCSFGHILTPRPSQRRNGTIKRSKARSTKSSHSTSSTSSGGTQLEGRSSSRKKSPGLTKRRAQRDTFRQERVKPRGVRNLPHLPPLPPLPPVPYMYQPLPATPSPPTAVLAAANMRADIATLAITKETISNISPTNMTKIEISSVVHVSAAPSVPMNMSDAVPSLQPGGSPMPPHPKRRPLPTPPIVQKNSNASVSTTMPPATPASTLSTLPSFPPPPPPAAVVFEKPPRLFQPHHSFLTISTDSSTSSPVDFFPALIGMMDNMILARS
ncbi:hypothetical protein FRC18_007045 [Serendipita sp. 400]|nr:hypothetical protein FRC18_007045 [Serendipita sp. 400]